MATIIKEVRSRRGRYDWAKWTNGRAWRVVKGSDFDVEPAAFAAVLYTRARRMNRKVRVSIDRGAVEFQFSKPSK